MTPRLRIDESRTGDVTILRLNGRLEIEEGDTMLSDHVNALVRHGRAQIVLDMAEVTRLDSMGLGVLASKLLTTRREGGGLKLLHTRGHTAHMLDVTGLSAVFEVFDDEGEAVRSFRASAAATP